MARLILTILLALSLIWGCAASSPAELKTARTAVAKAYAAGAPQYAPAAYRVARAALKHGETLAERGDCEHARGPLIIASKKAVQAIFRSRKERADQLKRARQAADRAAAAAEGERLRQATAAIYSNPHPQLPPPKKIAAPAVAPRHETKPSPPPPPPKPVVKYTVAEGETLWTIAARKDIYLDALLWPLIYKANRDQIKDPRQIYPGQVLNIPREISQSEIEDARARARRSRVFPLEVLMKNQQAGN